MKKLFYCLFLVLFISCIGQNAPVFDNESIVTSIEKIHPKYEIYYMQVSKVQNNYSFTVNNTYFVTNDNKFIVGDTIVAISKRELRILLNGKK